MPAQNNPARPATASGEPGRATETVEPGRQPPPAPASASIAAERADELRRRSAAVLQRADTLLRRADALLASSHRRLTRS
jgi:hypothetical protein